jgi:ABC-2 type transport system permease protein
LGDPPGNIDHGGVWGSYIGLFFIGAVFVAIGVFCSSLTQNQVVAFILAVFVCFILYIGLDLLASYSVFGSFDTVVRNLGIYEHYQSIKRGVVDTRDVIYFISVIVVFLLATRSVLEMRRRSNWTQFFISVGIIVVLNFIGTFKFLRFDLTTDKIHSLSPATINFIEKKIKGHSVFVKIYLTGKLPADLKYLEKSVKEKLQEMKAYAGNNLEFEFIDPNTGKDEKEKNEFRAQLAYDKKIRYGVLQTEDDGITGQTFVFPGATVSYNGGPEQRIQFFVKDLIYKDDPMLRPLVWASIDQLEYKIVDGIKKSMEPIRPQLAILQGHGEASPDQLGIVVNALTEFCDVAFVTINEKIHALDTYHALLVCGPDSAFSDKDKFVIDQFIMRGGKTAWFIDPMEVRLDTLLKRGQTFGLPLDLKLHDMLFTYGVRINNNLLIDKKSGPIEIPGYPGQYAQWPFYPVIQPSDQHAITRNINPLRTEYVSGMDLVGDTLDVKKTVLLTTSEKTVIYNSPVRINYSIVDINPYSNHNLRPNQPVAVLLEGKFNSAFRFLLAESFTASKDYKTLEKCTRDNRMLVVSDADMIINRVDSVYNTGLKRFEKAYLRLDKDRYKVTNKDGSPKYVYGNLQFFQNAMEYLLGDESLIQLRQRTVAIRKLDTVRVAAEKSYWQMVNIVFPIIVIIAFGIIQHYLRKRKYAAR